MTKSTPRNNAKGYDREKREIWSTWHNVHAWIRTRRTIV